MKRLAAVVAGSALLTLGLSPAVASNPPSQKVTLSQQPGTYVYTWKGTIPPGATAVKGAADQSPCLPNSPDTDKHIIELSFANSRVYKDALAVFTFSVQWATSSNATDSALNVLGPHGGSLGRSDGASTREIVRISNPDDGNYQVLTCGFSRAIPEEYSGTLEITVTPRPKKPVKSVAAATDGSDSGAGGTASPTRPPRAPGSPTSPARMGAPMFGAGAAVPGEPLPTGAPPAESVSAPTAFIGGPIEPDASGVPAPIVTNRGDTAGVPIVAAVAVILLGVAGGVFALLLRRRRGLDQIPGTAIVAAG